MEFIHPIKILPLLAVIFVVFVVNMIAAEVSVADCATCHESIHREWSRSLHADAWQSPVFSHKRQQTAGSRKSACDCHAPGFVAGARPVAAISLRDGDKSDGVDCLSCHVDADRMIFSTGDSLFVPHFTAKAAHYATGAFCVSCHKWAKKSEFDCQDCHMPSAPGGSSSGKYIASQTEASHSSHRFSGSRDPEFLSDGAELSVELSGSKLEMTVASLVPAHTFPAVKHHSLMLAVVSKERGDAGWSSEIELEAGGTLKLEAPAEHGAVVELRFYPSTEVWPDSFYVVQRIRK